jgi:hypothetical protein
MNRQFGVLLAVGAVVGVAAVTGAIAIDGSPAPTQANTTDDPTATPAPVDGTVIDSDNETLRLDAAEGQVVSGRTDIAAGENLTIRLQSVDNASTAFLINTETTVSEDGRYRTTVDLSGITDQPAFELRVRHDGDVVANRSGQVVGNATDPVGDDDYEAYEPVGNDSETPTADASFVVEGDQLTLPATADATVDAEADLDAGTTVDVRLRSTNASAPFLRVEEATVNDDGTLSATFNMSATEPGDEFEASIYNNGSTLTTEPGVVAE